MMATGCEFGQFVQGSQAGGADGDDLLDSVSEMVGMEVLAWRGAPEDPWGRRVGGGQTVPGFAGEQPEGPRRAVASGRC